MCPVYRYRRRRRCALACLHASPQVIQWLLLSIALACAALVVVGCLVLPITAAEEVAQGTAKVLAGTAKALDRCEIPMAMPHAHMDY
jgi:hypothetical protein